MSEVIQKAMDFGLSWVATIGLAWYVWWLNKTNREEVNTLRKEHKEDLKEIAEKQSAQMEKLTDKYTGEIERLRETVDKNTEAFNTLKDVLANHLTVVTGN